MDKYSIAVHEAGHAVIGRVLTLPCEGASIQQDLNDMSAGFSITPDPYACTYEWERRGRVRDSATAVWHARIVTFMAGAEAELIILGKCEGGDGDDRYQIEMMAESELGLSETAWNLREQRLRRMTKMLVRRHRDRILKAADALLAEETITAKSLDDYWSFRR